MDRPGRKLFISGKGRCNLTNRAPLDEFIAHFGSNGKFLRQAFHRFFSPELIEFFERQGVPTIIERGGRVFPLSESARDVIDALIDWNMTNGVDLHTHAPVHEFLIEGNGIKGVRTPQATYFSKIVIVTTGGASYPGTGSTGDGYHLAKTVGHKIIPIRPALVPLITAGNLAKQCQGLSLRNVKVTVWTDGKKTDEGFGEMLFTHFGISGPIILTISGKIVDSLAQKRSVEISIDLKPALDDKKLDLRLLRDIDSYGKKHFHSILKGLLPQKLIPVCIRQTGISADKVCNQITSSERRKLRNWLKDFRLVITGHRSFRQAIITAGGVDTTEIDPRTMASRRIVGLYFAGEVLDVDADTGGYNLQAAFSTGWLAGLSAAEYLNQESNE
jgi:predicted Rossmann fold flavoprotein